MGADIYWISKFWGEQEVLLPPWYVATPDCSRQTDLEYLRMGQNPNAIGNIVPNGRFSVYSSERDARLAIESATTFK